MKSFKQKPEEMKLFLSFLEEDLDNINRARKSLEDAEIDYEFEIHPKAETVNESASYSPIEKNQIIKTLIFKANDSIIGVLCPGDKRTSEKKLEELTSSNIEMASPSKVQKETGYVVGGVSPFDLEIPLYMDSSLLEHEEVRPAGGSRVVGVCLNPKDLRETIDAEIADITE